MLLALVHTSSTKVGESLRDELTERLTEYAIMHSESAGRRNSLCDRFTPSLIAVVEPLTARPAALGRRLPVTAPGSRRTA